MNKRIKELIVSARNLPQVPIESAKIFDSKRKELVPLIDDYLSNLNEINSIIGNNPIEVMYDNHKNHASFMSTVFYIGNYELLAKTILWVYKAYSQHNFSYDYFPIELNKWKKVIKENLPENCYEILIIYEWLINNHNTFIELSESEDINIKMPIKWLDVKNNFFSALLAGNHYECLRISEKFLIENNKLEELYINIIQPSMQEIGKLWEQNKITVAHEHLASAIVSRIMANINKKPSAKTNIGKAVVTSSPNEFHELGAWMISDVFEQEGIDVKYLGSNTPDESILKMLKEFKPDFLAISVTMPFNLVKVKKLIDQIKSDRDLRNVRIMIGGRILNMNPNLWRSLNADAYANNFSEAKK